jgi:8-oxo-dGTP diphosphatase
MDVVAAALVCDGLVLAARRVDPPGWEFPGGKVEPGETAQQALARECHEELGIEIECVAQLGEAVDDRITLQLWHVTLRSGSPATSADHDALQWVDRDSLAALDWLPLDRILLADVERALG